MASEQEVKKYLAHWFQLGKVVFHNGQKQLHPQSVIEGDHYSAEFEDCWQQILAASRECYLQGTEQSVEELLSPNWEVSSCARCGIPIPMQSFGVPSLDCTCSDLDNWPNTELPAPRSPVDSSAQLNRIRERLNRTSTNNEQ